MKIELKLVAALLCCGLAWSPANATPQPVATDPGTAYVRPHQRVDIGGGRKLNLFCMASGGPTVLFDSGLSDWSSIWALVQPAVAKRTQACSYDRAGMGYSDPSETPRTPIAIVEDMHALVHAAKLPTPLLLVGHSLGGFNMKLYAAIYPEDVGGMVLVDPAEDRIPKRTAARYRRLLGTSGWAKDELEGFTGLTGAIDHYRDCAAAARIHPLDAASQLYKTCTDPVRTPLGTAIATERARLQVGANYQQTQSSEIANSVYGDPRGNDAYAALFQPGAFGDKPMIVLTHGIYDPKDPIDAADFATLKLVHDQTARLSRRGVNRVVPDTHHNIEVDNPQAIVDSVFEVMQGMRSHRALTHSKRVRPRAAHG